MTLAYLPVAPPSQKQNIGTIQDVERVVTEIRCLTELAHPNIVRLMDVVDDARHMVLRFLEQQWSWTWRK